MCIMEVRKGQRSSTIAQAMAHNTKTIESDLDLLRTLLKARGDNESLFRIDAAQWNLAAAYDQFLECFSDAVKSEIGHGDHGDDHDHNGSGERVHVHPNDQEIVAEAVEVMTADAHRAEKYETR